MLGTARVQAPAAHPLLMPIFLFDTLMSFGVIHDAESFQQVAALALIPSVLDSSADHTLALKLLQGL